MTYTCMASCAVVVGTCICKPVAVAEETYTCKAGGVVGSRPEEVGVEICTCKPAAAVVETCTCMVGGVVGSRPEEVVAETYTCKQVEGEVGTCSSKAVEEMSNGSLQRFQKASLGKW